MSSREKLLKVLETMSEETFGYVMIALKEVVEKNEWNHGFRHESTRSFVDLAKSLNEIIPDFIDMNPIKEHNPRLFE